MVDEGKVRCGDLVWVCIWSLSASRKRVVIPAKPRQVKIVDFNPVSRYLAVSELTDPETIAIWMHVKFFYYTEDEAWEAYNSDIYDAIDRETKLHERTLKHLKSMLHENRN